jgi:glycosyltransferase involved in cell wall biosynthesis
VSIPRVLHVLPHPGGGGESYVGLLEHLDAYKHERTYLSDRVEPLRALPSLTAGWPRVARAARAADVVHVHGDTGTLLALPALRGRRWIWTTHGLHMLRRSRGVHRALVDRGLRRAIRRAVSTVCTSSAELEELRALVDPGTEADRLTRVIVGIPAPEPAPDCRHRVRTELGIEDDTTVCVFAGSLEPRKEPVLAARAAVEARSGGADVLLLMTGEGPLRRELHTLAGDAVRVLGYRSDLDQLLGAADVFVMPSTREGLPLALLEAMSHGLVPVVAEEPGSVEAIGDAGVSVPAGDVAALTGALTALAQDAPRRERLAAAARDQQRAEFSLERFLTEMQSVYRRARLL